MGYWGIVVGDGVYRVGVRGDVRKHIPAYLNFGTPHVFSLYPKKLSYSSRNAYIQKLRARQLGKASCLHNNLKQKKKLTSLFGDD